AHDVPHDLRDDQGRHDVQDDADGRGADGHDARSLQRDDGDDGDGHAVHDDVRRHADDDLEQRLARDQIPGCGVPPPPVMPAWISSSIPSASLSVAVPPSCSAWSSSTWSASSWSSKSGTPSSSESRSAHSNVSGLPSSSTSVASVSGPSGVATHFIPPCAD